ncbi:hypothetical protein EYW49_20235 [Siculibacillus lacustris]|uniref:Uncharacterized protein n=1 Tax=Siculibacillus lacustris TaxID=1549641 RepID=A0A4Q9VF64_9HYPH|nr:hypothetical protein [Siculibacillus lacustris]TBW33507.1 hypothetical protein EYW49_20235 [Siculibacillus lacustris]
MDVTYAYTGLNSSLGSHLVSQRQLMTDLTLQETTKLKSQTYAGISDRSLTLAFQSKISENDAYQTTIDGIDTRLKLVTNSIEGMSKLSSNLAGSLDGNSFNLTSNGKTSAQVMAQNSLDGYISALNTEYGGLYVFGGKKTDSAPVEPSKTILDGDTTRAGYVTVAAQRLAADTGTSGLGRLTDGVSGTKVDLAEDGAHPFGVKLAGVTSTLSNATVTDATAASGGAAPHSLSVDFTGQPTAGEAVTLTLTQPDGSTTSIKLTAGTASSTDGKTFAIGATPADTATNLQAALDTQLKTVVATDTTAASAVQAANEFFDTTSGATPMRVSGPPYDTATALVAGTPTDTVFWYTGTNDSTNPRSDASALVDTNLTVDYGTRANETAFVDQIKQMAVLSTLDVSSGSDTAKALYQSAVTRTQPVLMNTTGAKTLQSLETEIAGSQKAASLASTRLSIATNTYQTSVDSSMQVDDTQVAVQITTLQTQIEASYKAASILYKLSLTNYL